MDTLPLDRAHDADDVSDRGGIAPGQRPAEIGSQEIPELRNSRSLVSWDHQTKRRRWQHTPRKVATVDVSGRVMYDDTGRRITVGSSTLGDVLRAAQGHPWVVVCDVDAVAIVRGWATATPPSGWRVRSAYVDDRAPCVDVEHLEHGGRVRLSCGIQWTGATVGPATTGEVLRRLRGLIEWSWRTYGGGTLLATPATTGRDLMARALPDELEWPVLSEEWAEHIRATSTQHRMELLVPAGTEVPGLVEMDARLAYAAVLWGLPVGEPAWSRGEPDEDRWMGRWRGHARWQVPEDWPHPWGVLPVHTGDGWVWPAEPGSWHTSWLDGSEADLARRLGWTVIVGEHLWWRKGPDPLKNWGKKLVGIWRDVNDLETHGEVREDTARALRHAVRAILLHGIGACHGTGQLVSTMMPVDDFTPEVGERAHSVQFADDDPGMDGDWLIVTTRARAAWPEMNRPEWTSTVWARNRCRLIDAPGARHTIGSGPPPRTGALHLPEGCDLIGFRGDCLYVTDNPHWYDDGREGRYRPKQAISAPFPMPGALHELDDLRRANSGTGAAAARAALDAIRNKAGAA